MSLIINLVYDSSALAAPQSFRDGMQQAAQMLEAAFSDNIAINIAVSYGQKDGQPLTGISYGQSTPVNETYSALRALLAEHATSAIDQESIAWLPETSALQGNSDFEIGRAQGKALGVVPPDASAIDGQVWMGTDFTGDELVAGALHEITHAMGRVAGMSLDLFRYRSPGQHVFGGRTPSPSAYFSLDGGNTDLADFDTQSDPGDFRNAPNDPFDATANGNALTPLDMTVMDVLGFTGRGINAPGSVFSGVYNNTIVLDISSAQNPALVTGIVSVDGAYGIVGQADAAWVVSNLGTIRSSGDTGVGVLLAAGGTVLNGRSGAAGALIAGGYQGIAISGASGNVANYGSVRAAGGAGVDLTAGGRVTNHQRAQIEGVYGIIFGAPRGTVVNSGTIGGTSGDAAYFAGGHDRIVDHPGAHFVGYAYAAVTRGNTLELAKGSQGGTIADLYGQFSGFTSTVKVDPGAVWQLSNPGYGAFSFTNDGTVTVGGSPFVFGAVQADQRQHGSIDAGNDTVEFTAAVGPRETVSLSGNAGTVQLDDPQAFHGRIAGFGAGAAIDLSSQQAAKVSDNGGQLTVFGEGGNTLEILAISGNLASSGFALSPDNHGGTLLTLSNSA